LCKGGVHISTIIKQSFTELKNQILSEIIACDNIIKALVVDGEDFLTKTPTADEQKKLNEKYKLIRKQIFPYKGVSFTSIKNDPYITMGFYNFQKKNNTFIRGIVQFYIFSPIQKEKTYEGSRYDFIADNLEVVFDKTGIGKFEFQGRSDVDINKDGYLCHMVTFEITDFHITQ